MKNSEEQRKTAKNSEKQAAPRLKITMSVLSTTTLNFFHIIDVFKELLYFLRPTVSFYSEVKSSQVNLKNPLMAKSVTANFPPRSTCQFLVGPTPPHFGFTLGSIVIFCSNEFKAFEFSRAARPALKSLALLTMHRDDAEEMYQKSSVTDFCHHAIFAQWVNKNVI